MTLFNQSNQAPQFNQATNQDTNQDTSQATTQATTQATNQTLSTHASRRSPFKTAALMAGVITMATASSLLVACGGSEHGEGHEVHAVDKVEEAAEMARANAPKPEDLKFEQTAAASTPSTQATGAATATSTPTEGQSTSTAETSANTDTTTAEASAKKDTSSTSDTAAAAQSPIVPETKPMLTGDTAQAADAAAAAVQKAE